MNEDTNHHNLVIDLDGVWFIHPLIIEGSSAPKFEKFWLAWTPPVEDLTHDTDDNESDVEKTGDEIVFHDWYGFEDNNHDQFSDC